MRTGAMVMVLVFMAVIAPGIVQGAPADNSRYGQRTDAKIHTNIVRSNGEPASNAIVEVYSSDGNLLLGRAVIGPSGMAGILISLFPETPANRNDKFIDTHLQLRVWLPPDELGIHDFTIRSRRENGGLVVPINNLSRLNVKLHKVKPYALPRSNFGSVQPYSWCGLWRTEVYPSVWTKVGELHATGGVSATFTYGVLPWKSSLR